MERFERRFKAAVRHRHATRGDGTAPRSRLLFLHSPRPSLVRCDRLTGHRSERVGQDLSTAVREPGGPERWDGRPQEDQDDLSDQFQGSRERCTRRGIGLWLVVAGRDADPPAVLAERHLGVTLVAHGTLRGGAEELKLLFKDVDTFGGRDRLEIRERGL